MLNQILHQILEKHLIPSNEYIYGFANMNGLLHKKYEDYPFGVSIGRKLDDNIVNGIKDAPTLEYFYHYENINKELQAISEKISSDFNEAGIGALTIKPTLSTNSGEFDPYLTTLRYEISHKMVATRAGLGWIGKTDLFISPVFGARLRLTSILINKEIKPELKPVDKSKCGECTVCVEKCPAKAATGQRWDINTDRDLFFNAFKCREKCGELCRIHLKVDRRICGICVAVCPLGRRDKS
jgi:epoxyqueuosine reductase